MAKIAESLGLVALANLREFATALPAPIHHQITQKGSIVSVSGPFLTEMKVDRGNSRPIKSAPETRMAVYTPANSGFELAPVSIIRAILTPQFGRGYLRWFILWTSEEREFLDALDYQQVAVFRADTPLGARRFVEGELMEFGGQVEDKLPPEQAGFRPLSGNFKTHRNGKPRRVGHPISMVDKNHSVHPYPCLGCGVPTTRRAYSHRDRREHFFCSEGCQK